MNNVLDEKIGKYIKMFAAGVFAILFIYLVYGNNLSKEQIKVSIRFLSNELRSDSIQVIAHKKTCDTLENCSTQKIDNKFATDIKDHILTTARSLKIEEDKKKN